MDSQNNYKKLREQIPDKITLVVAAKTRTAQEILEIINAGATDIGHNYVQEAEQMKKELGDGVKKIKWHLIGHLQKNKAAKAAQLFDVIQTVDSEELAQELDKQAQKQGKKLIVLMEVNIAQEQTKNGIKPDYALIEELARKISLMKNLELQGLMTMGTPTENKYEMRNQFKTMKEFFEKLKKAGMDVTKLSVGMSDNYETAIQEGSNMIRIGKKIFGKRK
jgi:PLP dependent protein